MSLPFTLSSVHHGLSEAQGTVRLTYDFLVFRVQVKLLRAFDRKPVTIKVAPEAIHRFYLDRGWFGDTLVLRPHEPDLLSAMPGGHTGEICLKVRRAYRKEAEALVEEVRDWARLDLYE